MVAISVQNTMFVVDVSTKAAPVQKSARTYSIDWYVCKGAFFLPGYENEKLVIYGSSLAVFNLQYLHRPIKNPGDLFPSSISNFALLYPYQTPSNRGQFVEATSPGDNLGHIYLFLDTNEVLHFKYYKNRYYITLDNYVIPKGRFFILSYAVFEEGTNQTQEQSNFQIVRTKLYNGDGFDIPLSDINYDFSKQIIYGVYNLEEEYLVFSIECKIFSANYVFVQNLIVRVQQMLKLEVVND